MDKHWKIVIEWDEETSIWVSAHPELDGCFGQGETPEEALVDLEDSRKLWFEVLEMCVPKNSDALGVS